MNLAQASKYFDRIQVVDPFTGARLFLAQVEPYDDTKRDAYSAYRRILSVAPGTKIPTHRSVRLLGMDWIVGAGEADGMQELHRQKYVLSQASATLKVSTLAQYLQGQFSASVKAAPYWSKDAKQIDTSSEQPQLFDVFVSSSVEAKNILWDGTQAFLCTSARPMASGLLSAFSLKLTQTLEPAILRLRTYDPVVGGYTVNSSPAVNALRVRWQSLFEYNSQAEVRYQEGDLSVVLPGTPLVNTSTLVQFSDITYQVLSVEAMGGAQVAHCRKA